MNKHTPMEEQERLFKQTVQAYGKALGTNYWNARELWGERGPSVSYGEMAQHMYANGREAIGIMREAGQMFERGQCTMAMYKMLALRHLLPSAMDEKEFHRLEIACDEYFDFEKIEVLIPKYIYSINGNKIGKHVEIDSKPLLEEFGFSVLGEGTDELGNDEFYKCLLPEKWKRRYSTQCIKIFEGVDGIKLVQTCEFIESRGYTSSLNISQKGRKGVKIKNITISSD